MSEENNHQSNRYETVLLEDDPETLKLIKDKLEEREITVYAYSSGDDALQRLTDDPNIGAFVTDIEIRYPFPDGPRNGLQGYDVANQLYQKASYRFLNVLVLTQLDQEEALDSLNVFSIKHYNFSKLKWLKLSNPRDIEITFDALAMLVKELVEMSPTKWFDEVKALYPKSRWISERKEGNKLYAPYSEIYRKLWLSYEWDKIDEKIGQKAMEMVQSYRQGETLRLRGDHLSLTENPNEFTFLEHLIGRRVVYALRAIEPEYWEDMIRGEIPQEINFAELSAETWGKISNDSIKELVKDINKQIANLNDLRREFDNAQKKAEVLEEKRHRTAEDDQKLESIFERCRTLNSRIEPIKKSIKPLLEKLEDFLQKESQEVQEGLIPYLKYIGADYLKFDSAKPLNKKGGGRDPLTQTLLILSIRKQDIQDDNPNNWKLLLPEESKWLRNVLNKDFN